MASDYFKIQILMKYSQKSDHNPPLWGPELVDLFTHEALRPDEGGPVQIMAATGGTSVDFTAHGDGLALLAVNLDEDNYCDLTFRDHATGASDDKQRLYPIGSTDGLNFCVLSDWDSATALTLTANNAETKIMLIPISAKA